MAPMTSTRISGSAPIYPDSELVLGLVGPVGTNFDRFLDVLGRTLGSFGYEQRGMRLSELTRRFKIEAAASERADASAYAVDVERLMHAGNYLRHASGKGEFLALAAAKEISEQRPSDRVRVKTAHVMRSLKHPDEVRALRRIYGSGFYLLGVTVSEDERRSYLRDDKGCTPEDLNALLKRDEHEEDPRYLGSDGTNFGQRMRDTFQLSDAFVPLNDEAQLDRFLRLVFADPFQTPTADEHAMFLAFAAALRSGDLSRQVGAVVVTNAGDVVAIGANDVPCAGGGLYWPAPNDKRDHVQGTDSNEVRRDSIVADVLERLRPADQAADTWLAEGRKLLRGSQLMDITEYGRAAHAEMEALLSCARSGVSTRGGTLYSTTFPCHNCAKHIIAAGIKRVVYVEPYPKSQAKALFDDSIVLGAADGSDRVSFEPFVGIGPRRFFDLFSMSLSSGTSIKRKQGGQKVDWTREKGVVRVPLLPNSYLERETAAAEEIIGHTTDPEQSS